MKFQERNGESMKVSVIVPVYNRLEHFRALFLCLLRQKKTTWWAYNNRWWFITKVLDFIGDLIPKAQFKVKHVYQEDKGFRKTRALNNGVRNSSGDLLIFCDQDLIFGEEYVETIVNNIKDNIFLMGRAHHITEGGRKYCSIWHWKYKFIWWNNKKNFQLSM